MSHPELSFSLEAMRVLTDLRQLAQLTSTPAGAQRVAWGAEWRKARQWFREKVSELGLEVESDAAGNNWVTLAGESEMSLVVGSHLDSVPNGGWLDGPLGVMTGLELLRSYEGGKPPVTLRLVDWADEEGRFGRSLLGSSAAAGTLDVSAIRDLVDRTGVRLADALAENGVDLAGMTLAHEQFKKRKARAYLELHIEQGPILEEAGQPAAAVQGTFGVERHLLRFTGQAAHAGTTPIAMRRDAFLAAAEFALQCRTIAERHAKAGRRAVCTVGRVRVEPDIATAVPGLAEVSLDQRALDAFILAEMVQDARQAAQQCAERNQVAVALQRVFHMPPRIFAPSLIQLAEQCVGEVIEPQGRRQRPVIGRLPSGALHDATEMALLVPTVMMFTSSTKGLSHCKEEDTPTDHLDAAIRAFLRLVMLTMERLRTHEEA